MGALDRAGSWAALGCLAALFACSSEGEPLPPGEVIAKDVNRIEWSAPELYYAFVVRSSSTIRTTQTIFAADRDSPILELGYNETWVGMREGAFVVARSSDIQNDLELLLSDGESFESLPLLGTIAIALLDSDWVYYFDDGTLMRVRWEGGENEMVATEDLLRADPATSHDVWTSATSDEDFVYYAENVRYAHRLSKADGTVSLLLDIGDLLPDFERLPQPYGIANNLDHVYLSFNNQNGAESGAIVRIEKASGVAELLVLDTHNPLALAIDDTYVYWTRNERNRFAEVGEGAVVRANKDGSGFRIVAERQNGPIRLALTPEYVYWQNAVTTELRRLRLPR
jgi:hypothetical protein